MAKSWRALEEIARLEQRLEIRKGKFISLIHTPSIKALTPEERKDFFKYMKNKGKIGKFLSVIAVLTLMVGIVFRKELTGGIVSENIISSNLFSIILMVIAIILLLIIIYLKAREKRIKKKFKEHMRLAERLIG